MISALIELETNDRKKITNFFWDSSSHLFLAKYPLCIAIPLNLADKKIIDHFSIGPLIYGVIRCNSKVSAYLNLESFFETTCQLNEIKQFKIYLISWDENSWDSKVIFLQLNKIKFNLTGNAEFIRTRKDKTISFKAFKKKFPNVEFSHHYCYIG